MKCWRAIGENGCWENVGQSVLKLINDSSSQMKANHYREGGLEM